MSIFKAYDVRGIYGKDLSEKEAYLIGYYLSKQLDFEKISVASDVRESSDSLSKFLILGLLDSQIDVKYLGKSSTPSFYFSLFEDRKTGVMITASHNPGEYNGFKIIYEGSSFDSRNGLLDLKKLVEEDEDNKVLEFEQVKDSIMHFDLDDFLSERGVLRENFNGRYVNFLKNFYDMVLTEEERKVLKDIKFSIDFSSGMSSIANEEFYDLADIKIESLNSVPDGKFPIHNPDPFKAVDYVKKNVSGESLFTCVFDGDGDRIMFFDEKKNLVLPDYVIALFVDFFSEKSKKFVCDLRVSKVLKDLAFEKHINIDFIRVGRAFYQDHMIENSCVFGAELSGHYFFRDFHNFDNPDVALIYMLKIVALNILENGVLDFKFSKLVDKYKKYSKIQEKNVEVKDSDKALSYFKKKYEKNLVLEIDGYSFDFESYWFNLRKSNTEPVIRINIEGNSLKETEKKLQEIVKELEKN